MDDGAELYASSLDKIATTLAEWSTDDPARQKVMTALRSQVDIACDVSAEGDIDSTFCDSFLKVAVGSAAPPVAALGH